MSGGFATEVLISSLVIVVGEVAVIQKTLPGSPEKYGVVCEKEREISVK